MTASKVLIDTNVVSYILKGDSLGMLYAPHLRGVVSAVSFITVGELYFWAEISNWGPERRNDLDARLRGFLVIAFEHEIARIYGAVMAERRRLGRPISPSDAWIAASALRHDIPLVTHNARDFTQISGLTVITEAVDA